jgi:hypothetical protein
MLCIMLVCQLYRVLLLLLLDLLLLLFDLFIHLFLSFVQLLFQLIIFLYLTFIAHCSMEKFCSDPGLYSRYFDPVTVQHHHLASQ